MNNETLSIYRQARWATLLAAFAMGAIAYPLWRVEGSAPAMLAAVIGLVSLALSVYFQCVIKRWRSKLFVSLALALALLGGGIVGTQTMTGDGADAHTIYCGSAPSRYTNYGMDWLAWYNCWLTAFYHDLWHVEMAVAANLRG